jgi:hypothetical protein
MGIQQLGGALLRTLTAATLAAAIAVACGGSNSIGGPFGNIEAGTDDGAAGSGSDATTVGDDGSNPLFGQDGAFLGDGNRPIVGSDGGVSCGLYQSLCSGACIGTNLDPNNCGGCGKVCAAGQACSAGVCSSGCTTPTNGGTIQIIKCGALCVDQWTDNHNCGACGNDCTRANQVCSGGTCVAAGITVNSAGKSCPGGGPPIVLNGGTAPTCAGALAQTTFRWGMCACGNVQLVNSGQPWGPAHPGLDFPALYIDSYDSSKGPWDPNNPQLGGSLGLNGTFNSVGTAGNNSPGTFTFLTGHMWSSSSIDTGGVTDVKQELHTTGPITSAAGYAFSVGQPNSANPVVPVSPGTASWDGYVSGNISASPMTFYKDLYVPPGGSTRTGVTVVGSTKNATFTVPPPCDSCASRTIPVGAFVDHYAPASNNDDAAIGLSPSAMSNLTATTRLDLPCGVYYLDSINSTGSITVYAHGRTALFIGGNVNAAILSMSVDPTGSFDVFVKGTVTTSADIVIGNPNYAAATRFYVGSPGIRLSGEAHFAGLVYMAGSDIDLTSHITAYGALYCNNFIGQGDNTDIHYDRAALQLGKECCDNGNSEIPGCPKTPTCGTCKDCGNQACINGACGQCTTSAQCCPPLTCQSGVCTAPLM